MAKRARWSIPDEQQQLAASCRWSSTLSKDPVDCINFITAVIEPAQLLRTFGPHTDTPLKPYVEIPLLAS